MPASALSAEDLAAKESLSAGELLRWAASAYHPNIALASSFGAEDVVLIDLLAGIAPVRVFTLDTGRLNQETYDLMDRIRRRYGVSVEVYCPQAGAVERIAREKGMNFFRESVEGRKLCCAVRKVEPLGRALSGLDAWITGLRREQAVTRREIRKVEKDDDHGGILKLNPLAEWTHEQVWEYIRGRQIPYNLLHDHGYPSIGCAPCTRAVLAGEDVRAGRWWWESPEHKECGLHKPERKGDPAKAAAPRA
jgi:phosphoadenosine phosphosulfate reductase